MRHDFVKKRKQAFARNLRQFMTAAEMLPKDLADATGISRNSVSNYLHGYCMPTDESLGRLAHTLGVTSDELLGDGVPQLSPAPSTGGGGEAPTITTGGPGDKRPAASDTSAGCRPSDCLSFIPYVGRVSLNDAAKALSVSEASVARSLQTGTAPYGYATPAPGNKNRMWDYHISAAKLRAYMTNEADIMDLCPLRQAAKGAA